MNENNLRVLITQLSYLIPGTDDSSKKHKEVTHGNQAGPDHQGKYMEQLLEDGLDADQNKDSEENSQRSGDSDNKGDVILDTLQRDCSVTKIQLTPRSNCTCMTATR